ncbi:glycoside hydrolase family 130 protein [Saccharibacillus sp. CPCC 101409]|uniref:BtaManbiosPhlase n=1 Tax=Saccharibacillus sp. CPCC 101409 TaxID=3058041 RepID=UPI0026731D75|nr:glycoside hydrolase family 130 protein [Saccharibacillus sp. CPCC 101409]MDO3411470.1 glycoside hydrolase family 130 protein [Saccharibacillus sp. CPCC 101409]
MNSQRYEENPLIAPKDVKPYHAGFEVIGAFNAGVAVYEGETLLLLRVAERPLPPREGVVGAPVYNPDSGEVAVKELRLDDERYDFSDPRTIREKGSEGAFAYLTSLSYIRIARSADGRHFTVDDKPFIYPSGELETFGIEDPRVTQIGDTYYIYFSAASPVGIGESLVSTKDFVHTEHHGMIFGPDNKDVIIFPEKVGGKYYALHRPTTPSTGRPEVWLAESDNLLYWGNHKHLLGLRADRWDSGRIGGGAVPIRTERGWLALYHGATKEHRYCMGAVLLDADDPSRVLARSARPILEPEAPYETDGFFGGVVFACGAVVDGDVVRLYYGAADTSTACAELSLREILDGLEPV